MPHIDAVVHGVEARDATFGFTDRDGPAARDLRLTPVETGPRRVRGELSWLR